MKQRLPSALVLMRRIPTTGSVCIVGGKEEETFPSGYAVPCGVCRQVMMEFCDPETFRIIVAADPEHYEIFLLKDLIPRGFGPGNLKG